MKLILAILRADAVDPVSRALVDQKYPVTKISSVGGFLRSGNTTLVIGVEENKVQEVLDAIREACSQLHGGAAHAATIFVLNAAQFVQI